MKLVQILPALCVAAFGLDLSHVDITEVEIFAPKLAKHLKRTQLEPELLAEELRTSPIAQIAPVIESATPHPSLFTNTAPADATPIVLAHGMGDSCFNGGMKSITSAAGTHKGVYSVCIPGGKNQADDTMSGFFVNMNKNVDIFAAKVRADPKLKNGFDAIGFSQGNSVIRGYIHRYNDPPVRNYLSVHGTVMGVAGFPNCNPSGVLAPICDILDEVLGAMAYSKVMQNSLFQAGYFRDPKRVNSTAYLQHSQIAGWNNENPAAVNDTYRSNFASLKSFNMVKAKKDSMVYPNEGEWWGQFVPGQFKTVQTMKETSMYKQDTFGLKSADSKGKVQFDTTEGNHLQFTLQQLQKWIDSYLI